MAKVTVDNLRSAIDEILDDYAGEAILDFPQLLRRGCEWGVALGGGLMDTHFLFFFYF